MWRQQNAQGVSDSSKGGSPDDMPEDEEAQRIWLLGDGGTPEASEMQSLVRQHRVENPAALPNTERERELMPVPVLPSREPLFGWSSSSDEDVSEEDLFEPEPEPEPQPEQEPARVGGHTTEPATCVAQATARSGAGDESITVTLNRSRDGFGIKIGPSCEVLAASPSAEAAGVTVGMTIVQVNGTAVLCEEALFSKMKEMKGPSVEIKLHNTAAGPQRCRALTVDEFPGKVFACVYHGTNSRAARRIACSQRFLLSEDGMLGKGVYATRTKQKAEGYRVHHPGKTSVGRAGNAPLRTGRPDPGCILQFRVRAGVMKTFQREEQTAQRSLGTWSNEVVLDPDPAVHAAAIRSGVADGVMYNTAFSAGCPCCKIHGEDCPGHPDKGHRPPIGTMPCLGRCATGFCNCPHSLSSLEEFCIYDPERIDQIEIIDGPPELIGLGRNLWGADPMARDQASASLEAELGAEREAAIETASVAFAATAAAVRDAAEALELAQTLAPDRADLIRKAFPCLGFSRLTQLETVSGLELSGFALACGVDQSDVSHSSLNYRDFVGVYVPTLSGKSERYTNALHNSKAVFYVRRGQWILEDTCEAASVGSNLRASLRTNTPLPGKSIWQCSVGGDREVEVTELGPEETKERIAFYEDKAHTAMEQQLAKHAGFTLESDFAKYAGFYQLAGRHAGWPRFIRRCPASDRLEVTLPWSHDRTHGFGMVIDSNGVVTSLRSVGIRGNSRNAPIDEHASAAVGVLDAAVQAAGTTSSSTVQEYFTATLIRPKEGFGIKIGHNCEVLEFARAPGGWKSVAETAGVLPGMVIVEINGTPVSDKKSAMAAITRGSSTQTRFKFRIATRIRPSSFCESAEAGGVLIGMRIIEIDGKLVDSKQSIKRATKASINGCSDVRTTTFTFDRRGCCAEMQCFRSPRDHSWVLHDEEELDDLTFAPHYVSGLLPSGLVDSQQWKMTYTVDGVRKRILQLFALHEPAIDAATELARWEGTESELLHYLTRTYEHVDSDSLSLKMQLRMHDEATGLCTDSERAVLLEREQQRVAATEIMSTTRTCEMVPAPVLEVRGHPNSVFDGLYWRTQDVEGWPRFRNTAGCHLYRNVGFDQWIFSVDLSCDAADCVSCSSPVMWQPDASVGITTGLQSSTDRTLAVKIARCNDLLPMNRNGRSDPYAIVELLQGENYEDEQSFTTSTVPQTLDPVFTDRPREFRMQYESYKKNGCWLRVTIFNDKDKKRRQNDRMEGLVQLDLNKWFKGQWPSHPQKLQLREVISLTDPDKRITIPESKRRLKHPYGTVEVHLDFYGHSLWRYKKQTVDIVVSPLAEPESVSQQAPNSVALSSPQPQQLQDSRPYRSESHCYENNWRWATALQRNQETNCRAVALASIRAFWHLAQPLVCSWIVVAHSPGCLSAGRCSDVEGHSLLQLICAMCLLIRQGAYLLGTLLCIAFRPAFLRVNQNYSHYCLPRELRTRRFSTYFFLGMYIVAPDKLLAAGFAKSSWPFKCILGSPHLHSILAVCELFSIIAIVNAMMPATWPQWSDHQCQVSPANFRKRGYQPLHNVSAATAACQADPSCLYIYDGSCDGEWMLCDSLTTRHNSTWKLSCMARVHASLVLNQNAAGVEQPLLLAHAFPATSMVFTVLTGIAADMYGNGISHSILAMFRGVISVWLYAVLVICPQMIVVEFLFVGMSVVVALTVYMFVFLCVAVLNLVRLIDTRSGSTSGAPFLMGIILALYVVPYGIVCGISWSDGRVAAEDLIWLGKGSTDAIKMIATPLSLDSWVSWLMVLIGWACVLLFVPILVWLLDYIPCAEKLPCAKKLINC